MSDIPLGFCHCGCGQETRIAGRNSTRSGWVKGQPLRFLPNHTKKTSPRHSLIAMPCECGCGILASPGKRFKPGHYAKLPIKRPRIDPAVRFWAKVKKARGCWEWLGFKDDKGYGRFQRASRQATTAHRMAYILEFGDIPDAQVVRHRCDNPGCCRPSHLELGSPADNNWDMAARKRHRIYTHPDLRNQGSTNGQAKLTDDLVREIRTAYAQKEGTQRVLAARFGVRQQAVSKIVRGLRWHHL